MAEATKEQAFKLPQSSPLSERQESCFTSITTPSSTVMQNEPSTQPGVPLSGHVLPAAAHLQCSASASCVEDFKCNICLNIASDAVLTLCGHLFCWPCLYTWLHYHSRYKECPVCKGAASETCLIPIYSLGTCKDAGNSSKLHNNSNIPPRPPARRVERERQRWQRYDTERERHGDQHASMEIDIAALNQVLFGLNDSALPRDTRSLNNSSNSSSSSTSAATTTTTTTNNTATSNDNSSHGNPHLVGRETRASWLERLRAMREERLAWPVAFVHGLTSRELLLQRRQARELMLSPRLMNLSQDIAAINTNINIAGLQCQSGQTQAGSLQRAMSLACMDREPPRHFARSPSGGSANAGDTAAQNLTTMSSILSSMEVFAKALESTSAGSASRGHVPPAPHCVRVCNVPSDEQALWQSSMRGLLAQIERLMVQLQSMQPPITSTPAANHHIPSNHWTNNGNVAAPPAHPPPPPHHHHHHHHHYHVDSSLTDRSQMMNISMERGPLGGEGDARTNVRNSNLALGSSPRMGAHFDPTMNPSQCTMRASAPFSLHSHGLRASGEPHHRNSSKSRKRWDVTRMST